VRADLCFSSDRSVVVRFGEEICAQAREQVSRLVWLLQAERIGAVRNLNPAYTTVLVTFDPLRATHGEMERVLAGYLARLEAVTLPVTNPTSVKPAQADSAPADSGALHWAAICGKVGS